MAGVAQWPPFAVTSLRSNLRTLTALMEDPDKTLEVEVRGWLARLLVVRAAGFIEQGTVECCREHVRVNSGGTVRSFAHSWLERSKNPKPENLRELLGRFDSNYQEEFTKYMDENDGALYRDLCFLIDRRNKIAHDLNEGVGPSRALELASSAESVVDWFILRLNPHR